MRHLVLTLSLFLSFSAQAKISVLFHPHDPTLETIGDWIKGAQESIDIAMYNMETGDKSPVIQALKSPEVQTRLQNKSLRIRLIYEGYGTRLENEQRMGEIEALGIDARSLASGKKVHHKFAVIDAESSSPGVITGSANWSLSSYRNYNENILFIDNEPEATFLFQSEFDRLWNASTEYGSNMNADIPARNVAAADQSNMDIHFNSGRTVGTGSPDTEPLYGNVVRLLDNAQSHVEIASTRIRLQPVLEAIARAAARGVKIQILIGQDDYFDLYKRTEWLTSSPNIELRVKFYNLRPSQYMTFQMHNKLMIVDGNQILTGSYNWSESSENGHIENQVELRGDLAAEVLPSYQAEFAFLWEMGRSEYPNLVAELEALKAAGKKPKCGFTQMALGLEEISKLLSIQPSCGGSGN